MMRYTVEIPSLKPKYLGHVSTSMKDALKFAYREAKNGRLVEIKKYGTSKEIATVWIYHGIIEEANGKMLVRFKNNGKTTSIKVLKADGTISKRRVF